MERKYYVPTIDEFFVGFEFEWKNDCQKNVFETTITDPDIILIALGDYEHQSKEYILNHYRVKYLDIQDIEDCGFNYKIDCKDDRFIFSSKFKHYSDKNYNLLYSIRNNWAIIFVGEVSEAKTSFAGFIKNKSELNKLMQMLNIK